MRVLLILIPLIGLMVLFGQLEGGTILGIGDAQARIGRPLSPGSIAGVGRRMNRRAYRYGYGGGYYGGGAYAAPYYHGGGCHC